MVVSNNNSAIVNVCEKLQKYGLDFIVASLGSKENKELFLHEQAEVPADVLTYDSKFPDKSARNRELRNILQAIDRVYTLQNEQSSLLHERSVVEVEWAHFCSEMGIQRSDEPRKPIASGRLIDFWLKLETEENMNGPSFALDKLIESVRQMWRRFYCRYILQLKTAYSKGSIEPMIHELKMLFYQNRLREIDKRLGDIGEELSTYNSEVMSRSLGEMSMDVFKQALRDHYKKLPTTKFTEVGDIIGNWKEFVSRYPVVLSTAFSARLCVSPDAIYDYIIMDEASQVSVETGVLALTCARNAVVVGDAQQLPNVVTDDDRRKLDEIMASYKISEGYDCAKNSFLSSVCAVIPTVEQTLLREHYRCHPRIIDFCNQKFYGGNLLIMTKDEGEKDVLCAIKTVKGNHAVNQYNQREIDVVREEVLPLMKGLDDIGVVTPYNNQVAAFKRNLPQLDTATIHKFQGREKDAIIMSVVDNQISPFVDDANMLNVAVSRAKKKFCLVITGNDQGRRGNLTDLLDYINYENCTVTDSKVSSIFDYLYEQYAEKRIEWLKKQPKMSEYASELLTNSLLNDILTSEPEFSDLWYDPHVSMSDIITDMSLLDDDEKLYASRSGTHVDFMVYKRVSRKPVLAIETDGYSYHYKKTEQHVRDLKKNHIFQLYAIPLLRLSTKGSGERDVIINKLRESLGI